MTQEVITKEEALLETEWCDRLRNMEQVIIDNRNEEIEKRYNQLFVIWEVITNGWYKNYNKRDDNSESTLIEWLEYLRSNGVATSYPTWREQHKSIVTAVSSGATLETAIRSTCVAPRLATIMENNGVIRVSMPDGDRTLDTGGTVVVEHLDKAKDALGGDTYGQYAGKIAEIPSSRQASDTIRHDLKVKNLKVTALWEAPIPVGVEFRSFNVEVGAEDSEGETPYSSVVLLEKDMPKDVQRLYLRKLSQKFAHLADSAS